MPGLSSIFASRRARWVVLFNLAVMAIYLAAALATMRTVDRLALKDALEDARLEADIIMSRNLATHTYFTKELKPSVFDAIEGIRNSDYFDPRWMSSTYAVRHIDGIFKANKEFSNYYYKEAAINARTPENEADAIERDFIEALNRDPELDMASEAREIGGRKYYVVMKRGEVTEQACMRCHSTPDAAPADMVRQYGSQRAFGREVGRVVSALSIRIPMDEAMHQADEHADALMRIFFVVLGVLLVSQVYMTNMLIGNNARLDAEVQERKKVEAHLQEALAVKDNLIKEVNHRVKNNLAIIQSLLGLQAQSVEDTRARGYMLESESRIKAITKLHESLYRTGDIRSIDARGYLREFSTSLFNVFDAGRAGIELLVDVKPMELDIDVMIPVALIVNELLTNSVKYAFPGGGRGRVQLGLHRIEGGRLVLEVSDNGVGLPEGFDIETSNSLGMRIIASLMMQLEGAVDISSEGGATFRIEFSDHFV